MTDSDDWIDAHEAAIKHLDLLDQRERLISNLSDYVAVTTLPADDDIEAVLRS